MILFLINPWIITAVPPPVMTKVMISLLSVSLLRYTGMLFEYIYKYLINFLKIFPTEVFKDIYTKKVYINQYSLNNFL